MSASAPSRWIDLGPCAIGSWPDKHCAEEPCPGRVVCCFTTFTFRVDPLYLCAEHAADFMQAAADDLRALKDDEQ